MVSLRQLFLQHIGQTSDSPLMLEIERAHNIYMFSPTGKAYIDLIAGVSVSNVGHCHPKVVQAVQAQSEKYMHLMVYGEYVQSPQVKFAEKLTSLLPQKLNSTYFVNSGSEANEGAIKLAKRYTGRSEVVAFRNAYHGSTHGVLSLMSDESFKRPFRPLMPGVRLLGFNDKAGLEQISEKTACAIVEPIQGEAGIIQPQEGFLQALRQQCDRTGTLLIFDEVQTGFGRTGKLFAFQKYGVVPDILSIAKGMGGGMPIGAFVSDKKIMDSFKNNPVLGHITTFGGHPVSAAAALAALNVVLEEKLAETAPEKGLAFRKALKHPAIHNVRGTGLLLAFGVKDSHFLQNVLKRCIENGLVFDWFIYCDNYIRVSPPLTITFEQISKASQILLEAIDFFYKKQK